MSLPSDRWDRDFGSGSNLDQSLQNQDRADRLDRVTPLPPDAPLLRWVNIGTWQEAQLGTSGDGVSFSLTFRPTCYRRGPWRLLIEVCGGPHHEDWGCFDEADQPERNFHDEGRAKAEAEAIAAVLLADRMEAANAATTPTAAFLRRALQAQAAAKYRERSAAYTMEHASTVIDMLQEDLAEVTRQRDALRAALEGVIRVADRKTVEFDAARAALAQCPRPAQTGVADAAT